MGIWNNNRSRHRAAALALAWATGAFAEDDGERFKSDYDTDKHRDDEARMSAAEAKRQRRMARNRRIAAKEQAND